MKDIAIKALIFLGGVAVGNFGSSYFFKKKYEKECEAKYAKLADEEVNEMKKYYDEKLAQLEDSVDEAFVKEVFGEKEQTKEAVREPKLMKVSKDATDYTQFYKPEKPAPSAETEHPEDDDPIDIPEPTTVQEAIKYRDPHTIKNEEFGQNRRYDTMTLRYYKEDDILTVGDDQSEQILTDLDEEESVIKALLVKFKFNTNDQETICIRNDARMTDYQIIKVFGPFYE